MKSLSAEGTYDGCVTMRNIACCIIVLVFLPSAADADVLARFDFNTLDNNAATGTLVSTTGAGTLAALGGATTFFGFGTGSSDPEVGANDSGLGLGGFPAQGVGSGTVGLSGAVSTAGFDRVLVRLDQKNQPSSNKFYAVQARTAPAGPFIDVATYGIAASDLWENVKTFDVTSAVPAAANNPNFAFRIAAVFEPGTTQYVASEAGYNGDIPTLFDMIIVEGLVIPEPSSCLMLMIWLLTYFRVRQPVKWQ
jgi:hypothetical protein